MIRDNEINFLNLNMYGNNIWQERNQKIYIIYFFKYYILYSHFI